jgi:flagellar M-ring protein FliF
MPAVNVDQLRRKANQAMSGFSTGQKVVTGLAVVGLIIGGMMFSSWASKPTYTPLFSNLNSTDASSITQKLTSNKVPYKLADGGQTILVPQNQVYQQRMDLSAAGLPTGGAQGYSLLDKQGITTSEFQQHVDYQRALEGELAKTIGAIDGVAAASVHLVIPTQDVFADDSRKPSASVLIQNVPGKSMNSGQVQAVVHLVSSSVEGLTPDMVTVADSKGTVLSAPGVDGMSAAVGDARVQQTKTYEDTVAKSLQDMLSTVIGPGHSVVRVTADLDFDQRQTTTETYGNAKPAPALSEATTKETYTGNGNPPAAGVLGPTGGQTGATGTNSNYSKDDANRTFAVDKVTSVAQQAPGTVKRLSVAVVLDSAAKGADQATVQRLVSAAAGINANRGDTVAVDTMTFDQSQAKEAQKELSKVAKAKSQENMMSLFKTVGVLLLVGLVLLFVLRSSKRQRRMPIVIPPDLAELEAPRTPIEAVALGEGDDEDDAEVLQPALVGAPANALDTVPTNELPEAAVAQSDIVQLIERQPDEVAQLLRSWLGDRRS